MWRLFGNTWLVTALNPKGIVFFVAFLPQFINRHADINHQLWVLAITFVVIATINATLYAMFAVDGGVVPGVAACKAGVQYRGRLAVVDCGRVGVAGEAGDVLTHGRNPTISRFSLRPARAPDEVVAYGSDPDQLADVRFGAEARNATARPHRSRRFLAPAVRPRAHRPDG